MADKKLPHWAAGAVLALLAGPWTTAGGAQLDRARYIGLDEIKPGMKGFGRSVFKGTKIDEFQVEVLGVKSSGPKQSIIWVRCSGANLEHEGISRGMSGSPVYFRGAKGGKARMAGALAYAFSFAKDPIAGIQPIEQMLNIPGTDGKTEPAFASGGDVEWAPAEPSGAGPVTRWRQFGLAVQRRHPEPATTTYMDGTTVGALGIPLVTGRMSPVEAAWMGKMLAGTNLVPVAGGAMAPADAAGFAARLEPGSVLACPIMSGDMAMTALGTVTEVIDNAVLGFGHSFYGVGRLEVPMATGMVHTVLASMTISNKMGSALPDVQGSLITDERTAVVGWIGRKPKLIPMTVRVNLPGEREHTYRYEMVNSRYFTAGLVGQGVLASATVFHDIPELSTVEYSMKARFKGLPLFSFSNVTSGLGGFWGAFFLANMFADPVGTLMDNPLGQNEAISVETTLTVTPGRRDAVIEKVYSDRTDYKPGETVRIHVRMRPFRKEPVTESYELALPDDLPEGKHRILVGDAMMRLSDWRARMPHLFRVKNQRQLMETFLRIGSVRDDRLYVTLVLPQGGLAVDAQEMPDLPGSRAMIYGQSAGVDTSKFVQARQKVFESRYVVRGGDGLSINVSKRADQ